jgi:hypothetical protein
MPLCNAVNRRLGDTKAARDLTRRRVLVLILTPPLLATRDLGAALAGFLAIGISLSGALTFGRRWWPAYLIIATAVLLAPDAYTAFGLVFDLVAIVGLAGRCSARRSDGRRLQ